MALHNELEKIGLSEKEAKVYLATLELGQASVQDISQKSKVNRATTYVVLDSLINKGLCSTYLKDKKTFYMAESPEVLDSVFELQKKQIEEKQKSINNIMPQLRSVYNLKEDKPTVRYFEGKEGVRAMMKELLNSKSKVARMVYPADGLDKEFTREERELARKERIKKGIKTKVLYTKAKGKVLSTSDGDRIKVDDKDFPFKADIALFDNKIRIATFGKEFSGVIIQNKDMYDTLKSVFDLAWEAAEARKNKKKK